MYICGFCKYHGFLLIQFGYFQKYNRSVESSLDGSPAMSAAIISNQASLSHPG
jgi:hypothetical protein